MKQINMYTIVLDIIRLFLAVLFCYAAASKLLEIDLFVSQIGKSPLIQHHANIIAWLIPALELIISVCLFIPKTIQAALFASFTLMLIFTLYIAFLLLFSPHVPCSCGGILSTMDWNEHLVFNI